AYCATLCEDGERAATMDTIAARAGVSKGGLLYHFTSKEALAEATIDRFGEVAGRHLEEMAHAAEGPSRHFVRTSVQADTELDRWFGAVQRLAQAAHGPAIEALESVHASWLGLIRDEVDDEHAAEAIMLIGEGLYYHTTMPGSWSRGTFTASLESLLEQVDRLRQPAERTPPDQRGSPPSR
ncbi:TetR/AcrR family transcriptional regulator, partial [Nocardioides sp.]|uniref:TetR/AcrR family transcriptional regulator n=1 Tax=Nocardioides sp. TaxID=35761 RepID=UPI002733B0AD